MDTNKTVRSGFCIYIDTIAEGRVPVELNDEDYPWVYETEAEAQRAIAEDTIERLEQFLAGERDFGDAITIEEYIEPVKVLPDGSIVDDSGACFSRLRVRK